MRNMTWLIAAALAIPAAGHNGNGHDRNGDGQPDRRS
jgi:hypothetical protein